MFEYDESLADKLDLAGKAAVVCGVLAAIVCFFYAGAANLEYSFQDWGDEGVSPFWIVLGIADLIVGVLWYLFFKFMAQVVWSLRHLASADSQTRTEPKYGPLFPAPTRDDYVERDISRSRGRDEVPEKGDISLGKFFYKD